MEQYEKYKDSGIEWIGDIPEHWKIVPIKRLVGEENTLFLDGDWIESKDIVFDTDGIRYITTGNIGEGIYKEQGLGYITQDTFDKLNCTEVLPCDLVISRLNPPIGRCCIIPDLGKKIVTSVDNVILRPNKKFNKGFLKYVMSNEKYFEYTSLIARGATMQRISRSLLGDINIPVSFDFNEQNNIATFLDRKTSEIDQIIANKQKLIALYEEEKQAIINQAVTKGLDSKVTLKDSGIEWIGKIPEHWKTKKIKYIGKFINGYSFDSKDFIPSGIRVIKISNIQNMRIDWSDESFVDESLYEKYSAFRIFRDDLIFALTRPIISTGIKATIVDCDDKMLLNQRNSVLRTDKNNLDIKWLYYIILNQKFIQEFDSRIDKTGQQPNISSNDIGDITIPIPYIEEQKNIIELIENECSRLDSIMQKFKIQIDLLKEYRTTLISEVVTGKIKVPNTIEA